MRYWAIALLAFLLFAQNGLCISPKAKKRNLSQVNDHWRQFSDLSFIEANAYDHYQSGDALIYEHLYLVHNYLSNHYPEELTAQQIARRQAVLKQLRIYITQENFPQNHQYRKRIPLFIDDDYNYCAVGYLLLHTGFQSLTEDIRAHHNQAYIEELADHYPLADWARQFGFTIKELAWIQPTYDFEKIITYRPQRYLLSSAGYIHQQISDPLLSNDKMTVSGWYTQLGYLTYRDKMHIDATLQMGKASNSEPSGIGQFDVNGLFHYYRNKVLFNSISLSYGGGLRAQHSFRWLNNEPWTVKSSDGNMGLELAAKVRRGFNVRNSVIGFQYHLALPLISRVMRSPQLLTPVQTGIKRQQFSTLYQNANLGSWGTYFGLNTGLNIEWIFASRSKLVGSYNLQFFNSKQPPISRRFQQQVLLSIMTLL